MSCSLNRKKDILYAKGGNAMNPKEIGAFLKQLRSEKGITQEQLAEILGVSARTVSRWETGNNLPDLSILVQISEYYGVEIKEILNGERNETDMDHELKETLLKVADYHELEKQNTARAAQLAFCIMFFVCSLAITIQMVMTKSLMLVAGETFILLAGGFAYLYFIVKNGAWNAEKSSPKRDLAVSLLCTGIFTIVFWLMLKKSVSLSELTAVSLCFFITFSAVSYGVLRGLSRLSGTRKQSVGPR